MLLIIIIDELERQLGPRRKSADSVFLSYFFYQGTSSDLNTATAVLKGLVYLFGAQYPSLLSHIRESYGKAGPKLFKDAIAFFALLKILEYILHDETLTKAYIVIDALHKCIKGLDCLLRLIIQYTFA